MTDQPRAPRRGPLPASVDPRRFAAAAALVFLAALGLRAAFYIFRGPLVTLDGTEYARIAYNLREHGDYSLSTEPPLLPTAKRPPLYPAFLAAFAPGEDAPPAGAFAVQIVIDALVAVLVLFLSLDVVPFRWAVGAGLAYATHPGAILYTSFLLSETLFTAMLAVGAAALALALRRGSTRWTSVAGAAFGLAALCRPVALLLPLALALVVLAYAPSRRLAHVGLLVACALAVVVPWSAWSSWRMGRFVPVQSEVSAHMMSATRLEERVVVAPDGTVVDPAHESRWNVVEDVLRHPLRFLGNAVPKLPHLLLSGYGLVNGITPSFAELASRGRYDLLAIKLGMLAAFSALPFALAWVGLLRLRGAPGAGTCAGLWLYNLAIYLPFWSEYRFWVPATPFLLVSAIGGAYVLVARRRA